MDNKANTPAAESPHPSIWFDKELLRPYYSALCDIRRVALQVFSSASRFALDEFLEPDPVGLRTEGGMFFVVSEYTQPHCGYDTMGSRFTMNGLSLVTPLGSVHVCSEIGNHRGREELAVSRMGLEECTDAPLSSDGNPSVRSVFRVTHVDETAIPAPGVIAFHWRPRFSGPEYELQRRIMRELLAESGVSGVTLPEDPAAWRDEPALGRVHEAVCLLQKAMADSQRTVLGTRAREPYAPHARPDFKPFWHRTEGRCYVEVGVYDEWLASPSPTDPWHAVRTGAQWRSIERLWTPLGQVNGFDLGYHHNEKAVCDRFWADVDWDVEDVTEGVRLAWNGRPNDTIGFRKETYEGSGIPSRIYLLRRVGHVRLCTDAEFSGDTLYPCPTLEDGSYENTQRMLDAFWDAALTNTQPPAKKVKGLPLDSSS